MQRAVTDHLWVNAPRKDAIQFGQRPGPTARAAGRLATRLVAPRVVAATWWEHLLFLCAAWVCAVLAFCYVSGTALSITPGVLFAPFFPSFVVLVARVVVTTELSFSKQGATTFALNAAHVLFAPLGCALFFAKLWYETSAIPWWLVFLFPFLALTRVIFDTARDVVLKMPMTEFAALGYGPEGSAYEFAFSGAAPGEREIDTRSRPPREDVPFVARRVFEARAADEERASWATASEPDGAVEAGAERRETKEATKEATKDALPPGLAAYRPTPKMERTHPLAPTTVPPRAQPRAPRAAARALPDASGARIALPAPPARSGGFGSLPPTEQNLESGAGVASPAGVSPRFPTREVPARQSPKNVARGAAFGAFAKR